MFSGFQDIDGEVAQHLKRLGRKDPTTKVIIIIIIFLLIIYQLSRLWNTLPLKLSFSEQA